MQVSKIHKLWHVTSQSQIGISANNMISHLIENREQNLAKPQFLMDEPRKQHVAPYDHQRGERCTPKRTPPQSPLRAHRGGLCNACRAP